MLTQSQKEAVRALRNLDQQLLRRDSQILIIESLRKIFNCNAEIVPPLAVIKLLENERDKNYTAILYLLHRHDVVDTILSDVNNYLPFI